MPSPIGHLIAGYAVHAALRPLPVAGQSRERYVLVGTLFSALAADLDFLPGIVIGAPNYFHHGPSHSLGAVLLYGMGMWLILRLCKAAEALPLAWLFACGYGSHLVLDILARDTSYPFGIPLLWPLSSTYFISPVPLFTDIQRLEAKSWTFILSIFNAHNFLAMVWEIVLMTPVTLWMHRKKRSAILSKDAHYLRKPLMDSSETPWQLEMFDKALKKQQKLEALKKHVANLQGKSCLLITCGDNNGAMNYRIREWGGKWIWAELEEGSIHAIEELLREPIVQVDKSTCRLPFPDDAFDCVMTIDCHEHLDDPTLLNRELWRITKPQGAAIITVPNGNARKLAVRIKHLVGMTNIEYGHCVLGYEIEELQTMMRGVGFTPSAHSSYSKFFTEMIELCINFAYVKILAKKGSVGGEEHTIAPVTKEQLQSVTKTYKLYSMMYPFLWAVSQLDSLLFFTTGHAVVVQARKG